MTGLDHETTELVAIATAWIISHRHELPRPIVPAIRSRFGLSVMEAVSALRDANKGVADGNL